MGVDSLHPLLFLHLGPPVLMIAAAPSSLAAGSVVAWRHSTLGLSGYKPMAFLHCVDVRGRPW